MHESTYRELSDEERIGSVLEEISLKNTKPGAQKKRLQIDEDACDLLIHYVEDTVSSILREASLLASHRKSNVLEPEDLHLILLKKYGIEVPGTVQKKLLHKQTLDSNLNIATSRTILTAKSEIAPQVAPADTSEANPGAKRTRKG
jgi:histone H3/H4